MQERREHIEIMRRDAIDSQVVSLFAVVRAGSQIHDAVINLRIAQLQQIACALSRGLVVIFRETNQFGGGAAWAGRPIKIILQFCFLIHGGLSLERASLQGLAHLQHVALRALVVFDGIHQVANEENAAPALAEMVDVRRRNS